MLANLLEEQSQWSLTFEVRKSTLPSESLMTIWSSQWSLTFEVRKSGGR